MSNPPLPQPTLNHPPAAPALIVQAGALGHCIARNLPQRGARVRAPGRTGSNKPAVAILRQQGAAVVKADFNDAGALTEACAGAACVVSAVLVLREVTADLQAQLLAAAAGVPRFIPSDRCIDFTKLPAVSSRNLDLRRGFGQRLAGAPSAAASALNGMFMDLLTGQGPVVLFKGTV